MTEDAREIEAISDSIAIIVGQLKAHPELVVLEQLRAAPPLLVEAFRVALNMGLQYFRIAPQLGVTPQTVSHRIEALLATTKLSFAEVADAMRLALEKGVTFDRPDPGLSSLPTVVYRHFDSVGSLLYVGISSRHALERRTARHRLRSPWWSDVRSSTFDEFPDRVAALTAEADAIRTESPLYNIAGRP